MTQSASNGPDPRGLHVAIIMDGNGRWATSRGLPRLAGHRAGAAVVRRVVESAPDIGVGTLTLYAFSADNWRRPTAEVHGLLALLSEYLRRETRTCIDNGVRLCAVGRRDRFPESLRKALEETERVTRDGRTLELRLALDYASRDVFARAAAMLMAAGGRQVTQDDFVEAMARAMHADRANEVDVLIRTGGEKRLSDFLLWESAYAELFFTDTMWPDFTVEEMASIVRAFHGRERRFGGLPNRAAS
jgi:undecaprenyl diphosphate synthase